jgi:hypothetical protein
VFCTSRARASRLSRDLKAGRVRRLAPGLYTSNVAEPPPRLVRRLLWPIVSLLFPGAVVSGRTAFESGPSRDGSVFLTCDIDRDVELSGVLLRARKGPGPVEGDTPLLGVHMASRARAYLENLQPSRARRSVSRTLSQHEVEERLAADLGDRGEDYIKEVRERARAIAPKLRLKREYRELERMIGAALGTGARRARGGSSAGAARTAGRAYDARRMELFIALHTELAKLAPVSRPDPGRKGEERVLPFFEAYFSNVIDGVEIEVGAAADAVFKGRMPRERRAEAREVLGTYRVVSDRREMSRTPRTVEELLSLLRGRHAVAMEGRPERAPGTFRTVEERVGDTVLVAPDRVVGTLAQGWELGKKLLDPFQRAVFMLVLVSEVHPFADGSGRVARILMNAELVAAGERRIVVPTVFRGSYLAGIAAVGVNGAATSLIRGLDFLQRYTAAIEFATYQGARRQLEGTQAFLDPDHAEAEGVRLVLP